jgi:hypothetical protein
MPFNNDSTPGFKNNPLTKSVFVQNYQDGIVAPGVSQYIITEDELYITTETGLYLVTED